MANATESFHWPEGCRLDLGPVPTENAAHFLHIVSYEGIYPFSPMPCSVHWKSNQKCFECFTDELLQMTEQIRSGQEKPPDRKQLQDMSGWYRTALKAMKGSPSKDQDALVDTLIRNLNISILGKKSDLLFDLRDNHNAAIVGPVQAGERTAYRTRLRQMGTWVGFSEFVELADMFNAQFSIMYAASQQGRWNRWAVSNQGTDLSITGNNRIRALAFTGNHYEVGEFTEQNDGTFIRNRTVVTNPLGDCGLESFLLLWIESARIYSGHRANERYCATQFALARMAHQGGDGVAINAQDQHYIEAITELRDQLASLMSDQAVNDAVFAEGRPDAKSSSSGSKQSSSSSPSSGLVLISSGSADIKDFVAKLCLRSKRIGMAFSDVVITPRSGVNVFDVTPNYSADKNVLNDAEVVLTKGLSAKPQPVKRNSGLECKHVVKHSPLNPKDLDFIEDARQDCKSSVDKSKSATHLGVVLIRITLRNGTVLTFLYSAVNIDPIDGLQGKAKLCFMGASGTNKAHTEKVGMGIMLGILSHLGLKTQAVFNKVFDKHNKDCFDFTQDANPLGNNPPIGIEILFLNCTYMCDSCLGYWETIVDELLKLDSKLKIMARQTYPGC